METLSMGCLRISLELSGLLSIPMVVNLQILYVLSTHVSEKSHTDDFEKQSDDDMPNLGSPSKSALFTSKAGGVNGGMLASGGGLEFGSGAPNNLGKVGSAAGELSFFRSLSLCHS